MILKLVEKFEFLRIIHCSRICNFSKNQMGKGRDVWFRRIYFSEIKFSTLSRTFYYQSWSTV